MSTATAVPETRALTGGGARDTLREAGRRRLFLDSMKRFLAGDGTSHTRALAHASVLTFFPALIALVGLAATFHLTRFRMVLGGTIANLAPGPAGTVLQDALRQGSRNAGTAALLAGGATALVSGALAVSQLQRGASRIYGIEVDRRPARRFVLSFALNLTAGTMLLAAFALLAAGQAIGQAARASGWSAGAGTVFAVARWPVGIVLAFVGITILFTFAPNRRQPGASWMLSGTIVAVVLWFAFTALLALYFGLDSQLGKTYGPLLGMVGLLLWAYLSALALYLGLAFAAQLEAVRAGVPNARARSVLNVPDGESPAPWIA
jgi:YihY family inner membrane protein